MNDMMWIEKWVKRAKNDLLVAQNVFHNFHPKQLEICCYQCHQAVEKMLKAYLIFNNVDFPYTHNLAQLCQLCADFDDGFNNFIDNCSDLAPYGTQAHYPNDIEIEEEETELVLDKAKRILDYCISLIYPQEKGDVH